MYPYTKQDLLDNWVAGRYTEEGFLEISQWYEAWGYHWDYYRAIFMFAQENGIAMYALNTPREVIAAVRKKGFEELTEEEMAQMPPDIDTDNAEHMELFKAFFEDEDFHCLDDGRAVAEHVRRPVHLGRHLRQQCPQSPGEAPGSQGDPGGPGGLWPRHLRPGDPAPDRPVG